MIFLADFDKVDKKSNWKVAAHKYVVENEFEKMGGQSWA